MYFCFFKQKTAYEMRISDWSSDVCSSDLASLAFHPQALPGLEAELVWFDIDYTDRVVEPITSFSQALSNPAFFEFVQLNPSPDEQAAIVASADQLFNFSGLPYYPGMVVAFVDARYINAVRQRFKGIHLSEMDGRRAGKGCVRTGK